MHAETLRTADVRERDVDTRRLSGDRGRSGYAADTIGSVDIIDESILSLDLKNGEVKTADLAASVVQTRKDRQRPGLLRGRARRHPPERGTHRGGPGRQCGRYRRIGGGCGRPRRNGRGCGRYRRIGKPCGRSPTSFGGEDLLIRGIARSLNDPVRRRADDGDPASTRPNSSAVVGRCVNPAGTARRTRPRSRQDHHRSAGPCAVDSNAPNGVINITSLAHGAEATLISVGPTTFATGDGPVRGHDLRSSSGHLAVVPGFIGNVAARGACRRRRLPLPCDRSRLGAATAGECPRQPRQIRDRLLHREQAAVDELGRRRGAALAAAAA